MPDFKLHEAFARDDDASDGGAEEYKNRGNEAFKQGNWDEAIKNYNKAIQLDPKASYYSNRAACWSSKGNHESALADAKKCLDSDPSFVKGYSRKGKALFDLGRLDEAATAYEEGLKLEPSNAGCETGLKDVKAAKARASSSSSSSSSSWPSGAVPGGLAEGFDKIKGMGRKFVQSMQAGGIGGRVQMYGVVMIAYFLYNNYIKSPKKTEVTSDSHDFAEDDGASAEMDEVAPRFSRPRRAFAQLDGTWTSYLEAGTGDSTVFFLHSTSLSAEAELMMSMNLLQEKYASQPSAASGLQLVAPDRPCHGLSPCPRLAGKATATTWMESLLSARAPKAKNLVVVASGRGGARQALAWAKERTSPPSLLFVNPGSALPGRPKQSPLSSVAEAKTWLEGHPGANSSPLALSDALRWASTASTLVEEADEERLSAIGLPEATKISFLYGEGEPEESDLKEELEATGLLLHHRVAAAGGALAASEALSDALAEEVLSLLSHLEDSAN
mmetsp:Transcript_7479/g.16845  ORF Transcript_7479/g.16845 Transcript_7479/m.16845 type:complete len:501 (+) Transcript_7479:76-1578(+)|eukprot:CAMPEP_0206584808 /NCGR_PEP_ID=MMETSP0325_2-20121206/35992_1 /ASSEMBLY_ACC=CAM_ASM_000347 /TAXON_ID=2866 /ORGANISM="Crypthecodinium cohnii, Strain Seligo" /LENGTH=500 /DNA_ID=CAMNT_0054092135 /DNA_START=1 /DNA_END=1503 /DNA_ORIENTATION=-